ncbi:probable glutamyl endopeptidase, chloroplastic isoform X2 [Impatiens glandulifera]|uniref:probable glutamyl endopeptidase, chloroplastic isoform X1 n=1 Tax=Impatiens glandulifera TaxID=253017 RepID=UPI001FB13D1F|nr:probable glutamyl endopeptidase, chloroplastic isoform X1 [Impatiens glandulifera]XP_047315859.1 probable glutamyl endopeptidase, chloroplastic isoform X2 [Impatiens glandulifera]
MRLHKVYHRFSLLSSLSHHPSLLHHLIPKHLCSISLPRRSFPSPLSFSTRLNPSLACSSDAGFMTASMSRNSLPPGAFAASEDAGGNNASSASLYSPNEYLDDESTLCKAYQLPPPVIKDIVDAPPLPALSFSPQRDKILFLKRRSLPPLLELARPEEKLAGVRIDGSCNSRSRMSFYTGIGIHQLLPDGILGPEILVNGLPDGAKINFITWSNDGKHLSFSIRVDEEDNSCSKMRVWVADVETGKARPLFNSQDIYLNAVFDNFVWVNNSSLLVSTIPLSRGDPPKKPSVPPGPKVQSNEQKVVVQVRTFQDLLKDEYDEDLFEYYATAQLLLVDLDGTVKPFGPPAIYTSMDISPDEKYLLLSSIHRPYSFIVPCGRFPTKVDLWTTDGKFVRQLCDLPLAENIPIAFNSVRKGMRSINWRADKPSMLYWVETQDGGDAKVEVSPRDIVYMEPAEPVEGEQPRILQKLDLRYGGISWCEDSLALVYESWYKTRRVKTWVISPGSENVSPRILFDRSSEDVYSDPGSPMLRRTPAGTYVIAKVKKQNYEGTYVLLNGSGATPNGNIPFLDLFDINTGKKERIWESDKEKYYEMVVALMSDETDGDLELERLKILTSKESKTENTQYYIQSWPEKNACQITNFPHPYPQLASLQKEMIRYLRKDGVQLTATLYLPPGYDPAKDGPLPCLVWSYPGEFKSKEAAGQVRGSPNEFAGIGPTSPLLWLARRIAILSGPTIPIIGEGNEEANDRYVEQLVASAEAAVEEVIRRGVAHPKKIAVGGHSYGAFMTANLLAHAPHLFCCGIARSGAYNRTLTPFGFQNEDRTLWEATSTYVEMSPFMSANKIKKPILLIHGEEDNNSGTLTMQSDRFFNALKGHGALSRLVILPFESHGYASRESIMHVLWETDRWLHKYCVNNISDDTCEENPSKETTSSESNSKVVGATGGVGSLEMSVFDHQIFHPNCRSSL